MWLPDPGAIGKRVDELDTPCLVLDLDCVERNLDSMASFFSGRRARVRPHAKTHKTPRIALMQLERGALGVCCAKLGEAEVMAAGGVSPLLVTTEVVGPRKIARLLALARPVEVMTGVDDARAARALSDAALEAGLQVRCLIDVNVGQDRTGVEPGEPALALGLALEQMAGLELVGLQGYEGHIQHIADQDERSEANGSSMQLLGETAALLRERGLRMEIISTAGTGTFRQACEWPHVTEAQPGSYVVMDADYGRVEGLGFEQAMVVLSTVVSVNRRHAAIVDAGYKVLSTDAGMPRPRDLEAAFVMKGDEHGMLRFDGGCPVTVGDQVAIIPSHCDTTINLHDLYYVTRGDTVVAVWPIAARGKSQ
ncbi:MAG: DSD1 family PLP-dependent enzyme [Chloroflexi bacterium]|nr:DSD1 family PLP-dependent enzyme [Chloroflexota bacterium]